ncbi:MAG TPA: GAF domain-containing protein [Melioribacteraceae bacterium]|nr:GAF domain-containing protein [Melioribacteraceae bacterium]
MAEEINISLDLSDEEKYKLVLQHSEYLINKHEPVITGLSNICALLNQTFEKISWVGFYFFQNEVLYLGPYQGRVACTQIPIDKGVCGTAATKLKTVIVPDVEKFEGHIACDCGSRSEIVVPIIFNGKLFAVLDMDSYKLAAYNETDKKYLELLATLITTNLDLDSYILS